MGCGCKNNDTNIVVKPQYILATTKEEQERKNILIHLDVLSQNRKQVAWAVCMLCPHQQELKTCGIDLNPLREKVGSGDGCPLGKHPDGFNRVTWPIKGPFKGSKWKGLPYHQQFILATPKFRQKFMKYGIKPSATKLMGCGCSIFLKGLWCKFTKLIIPIGPKRSFIRNWPSVKLGNLLTNFYETAKKS